MKHMPTLRAVPAQGAPVPRPDYIYNDGEGTVVVRGPIQEPRPCGGCQRLTVEGELITKYRHAWWHAACARQDIDSGNATAGWLALAHDLARSPRSYRVGEIRSIVGALLGMIHERDMEEPSAS